MSKLSYSMQNNNNNKKDHLTDDEQIPCKYTDGDLNEALSHIRCTLLLAQNIQMVNNALAFSEAVASRDPPKFMAMQERLASWAAMSIGAFSVSARSMIWTCPSLRPGKASSELLLLGHITHRPGRKKKTLQWYLFTLRQPQYTPEH